MSARNSRAAKAARRTARRPRPLDKPRIAQAIHDAVRVLDRYEDHDAARGCVQYAGVGCIVLATLTGREWVPQAGAAQAGTGIDRDQPDGELYYAWRPDLAGNRELHAWCAQMPSGASNGLTQVPGDGLMIADFHLRHWPALARQAGTGWDRDDWPDYYWGTLAGTAKLRLCYRTLEAPTRFMWDRMTAYGASLRVCVGEGEQGHPERCRVRRGQVLEHPEQFRQWRRRPVGQWGRGRVLGRTAAVLIKISLLVPLAAEDGDAAVAAQQSNASVPVRVCVISSADIPATGGS